MPDTLVLADDVRRRLGLPRLDPAEVLGRQAAEYGLQLEFTADWAGRPCVAAELAAELVAAVEQAQQAAARQQAQAEHEHAARAAAADQWLQARADAVFQHVAETTGDLHAALALGHTAGRGEVSDEDVAAALDSALGRWREGYRTFNPEPASGVEDPAALADRVELRDFVRRHLPRVVEVEYKAEQQRRAREGR